VVIPTEQDLNIFYDLFIQTRKFRGVPGYPHNYFKDIMNNLNTKIYTSYLKNKPIASILLIYYKKEMRYAFAGTVHDRKIMQLQPYHLILWQAIKDAHSENYQMFNLGIMFNLASSVWKKMPLS